MSHLRALVATAIALLVFGRAAFAHPPGTTTVDLTLHDGRFEADLTIDAEALRLKQTAPRRPVVDLIAIAFDGVSVRPAVEMTASPDGQTAVVRLSGVTPPGATSVTWSSSLVYGAYVIAIRERRAEPVVQWLQGPQTSAPYRLHPPEEIGSRNNILFALALAASAHLLPRSPRRRQ